MRSTTFTITSVAVLSAAVSHAQSLGGLNLTDGCTQAVTGIAANPDASACLAPNSFANIFLTNSSASLVDPINNWLSDLCGAPACSNDTLTAVVNNVTSGCSTELSAFGASGNSSESVLPYILEYYPVAREIVCLKDSDQLCVTETLDNVESTYGTLSIDHLGAIASNGLDTSNLTSIPTNITCTNCVKEAYNILNEQSSRTQGFLTDSAVKQQCGDDFANGETPSGISQSASTEGASNDDDGDAAVVLTLKSVMQSVAAMFISGALLV